jgi:putative PIN family toxin of toxin-antitoxin system
VGLRAVVDTNVVISGLFLGGWPYRVLEGWRDGRVEIVVSGAILEEYWSVARRLSEEFPGVNAEPFLEMLLGLAEVVDTPAPPAPVCPDPDDDKFLACALASGAKVVVSGDRGLQGVSGYRGIKVVSPRRFVEEWLRVE